MKKISNDEVELLLQLQLKEYEVLREEIKTATEISSQIHLYTVLLLGGLIPLVQYIEGEKQSANNAPFYLYLLAALVFCAMGWYQINLDNGNANIICYFSEFLFPKIEATVSLIPVSKLLPGDMAPNFQWDSYWHKKQFGSFTNLWLSVGLIGRTGIGILAVAFLLGAFITNTTTWSILAIAGVVTVSFAILWILVSALIVRAKIQKATS